MGLGFVFHQQEVYLHSLCFIYLVLLKLMALGLSDAALGSRSGEDFEAKGDPKSDLLSGEEFFFLFFFFQGPQGSIYYRGFQKKLLQVDGSLD